MLRLTLAALLAIAATPSQALVLFDYAYASIDAATQGLDAFEPGPGNSGRSFSFSDIGGCEGADENGDNCGAYESSGFTLTLSDAGLVYDARLLQNHAIVFSTLDTDIQVLAAFRGNREMRFNRSETRSVNGFCTGSCPHTLWSNISQSEQGDGSWLAIVEVATSAASYEGYQQIRHQFALNIAEVPEPQAWTLLIAGFGLVGAAQRWRRAGLLA